MIPGNSLMLKCAYCGGIKLVLSLVSGNTFDGCQWSDTKGDYPMLPHVSMVQRCPHCGKYFFTSECKAGHSDKCESWDTGTLDYEQALEAWTQFNTEGIGQKQKFKLIMELIWAWNDRFVRAEDAAEPSQADREMLREWADEYIALQGMNDLLSCELLRECGRFEECLKALDAVRPSVGNDIMFVVNQIEAHAKAGDCKAFPLKPEN